MIVFEESRLLIQCHGKDASLLFQRIGKKPYKFKSNVDSKCLKDQLECLYATGLDSSLLNKVHFKTISVANQEAAHTIKYAKQKQNYFG